MQTTNGTHKAQGVTQAELDAFNAKKAAQKAAAEAAEAAALPQVEVDMQYDADTGMVTITFPFDPAGKYRVNEKTGKTRAVATSHGNVTVPGTRGLKVGVNAFLPL